MSIYEISEVLLLLKFIKVLLITDKPIFKKQNYSTTFNVIEGGDFSITLAAHANPPGITYYWKRGESTIPSALTNGPTLQMHGLRRTDSGWYTCEARSIEGSDHLSFQIDVTCKGFKHLQ